MLLSIFSQIIIACRCIATKILMLPITTAFWFLTWNYQRNFFTSHWEWTCPPNSWRNLLLHDCSSDSSTLTNESVLFLFSWVNTGNVSNWTVIYQYNIDNTTLENFRMSTEHNNTEANIVFIVITGTIKKLVLMTSNHKTVWNDYMQLEVWDYNMFWSTMVSSYITAK